MVLAVAANKTAYSYLDTISLTITGGAATTDYIVSLVTPSGHTTKIPVTTDGSGNATAKAVQQSARGTFTVAVRPAAEHNGTTTAGATTTTKGG